jgi:hypothetical protein
MNFVRLTAGTSLLLSVAIQARIARPLQSDDVIPHPDTPPEWMTLRFYRPHRALEGENDFGRRGYGSPMLPKARRSPLPLQSVSSRRQTGGRGGLTKDQLLEAMEGLVLSEGELTGISILSGWLKSSY